jgi:hypothetical protein
MREKKHEDTGRDHEECGFDYLGHYILLSFEELAHNARYPALRVNPSSQLSPLDGGTIRFNESVSSSGTDT